MSLKNYLRVANLNLKKNPLIVIIFLFATLFFFIIFIFNEHYPTHDEIITFDRYMRWHTFLRRNDPNNHLLMSFIGTLSNSLFSFNFYFLRFFSFLSLIGILLIYAKLFKNYYIFLFFCLIIIFSEFLINYSYLFRGYYLSSLISVTIFYFLYKYYYINNEIKYLSISFFFLFLLTIHSLYTLYIVIPIICSLLIFFIREKRLKLFIKRFIFFFLIPTIIIYFLVIIITGFSSEFSENLNIKFLINNLTNVVLTSFKPGIIAIFFDENIKVLNPGLSASILADNPETKSFLLPIKTRLTTINNLFNLFYLERVLFFILFFSFSLAIINFFLRKFNIFDSVVLIFFVFYIILNITPFIRVYISFIYFFIFYLVFNIEVRIKYFFLNIILKNSFSSFLICKTILILTLLNINININNNYAPELKNLKNEIKTINFFKNNCDLANKSLDQYHIWILINFYPDWCYYKYDFDKKINILSNLKLSSNYRKKI